MTIANVTRAIALADDSDFLGLPVQHHIAQNGYWYTYHPSDYDSNNVLAGNSLSIYQWDSAKPIYSNDRLSGYDYRIELDGTAAFIDESHGTGTLRYHGGAIQHIGSGINDITNTTENDAFFMAHIGTFGDNNTSATSPAGGSLEDDAFYWDRFYKESANDTFKYYQYHKHLPSNYPKYDDGRIVMDAHDYIRPADKQYGYLIGVRASSGGRSYNVPLARIHTPSVGGAHNSHNDVTLPSASGKNYLLGGIISGSSNRFHAAYLDSNGSGDFNLYTRTYTSTSGSFSAEVNYGSYDLASPVFTPYVGGNQDYEGKQSEYPLRLSAGHTFGSKVYWPTLVNAVTRDYGIYMYHNNQQNVFRLAPDSDGSGNETNGHRDDPAKLDGTSMSNGSQNPTVYLKVGDTVRFENPGYLSHPMYIKTTVSSDYFSSTLNIAPGSSGGGTARVTYTPQSAGEFYYVCIVHSNMYGKIVVEELSGCVDAQIWSVTDANTISPGTLQRVDLPWKFTGAKYKPDVLITSVGDKLYIAGGAARPGGLHLYSGYSADSTGAFYDEGQIIGTDSHNPARLMGFKYNATNTKFYALTDAQGETNYKGLYSFDLAGGTFDGYEHLKWNDSGYFENIGPNTSGHLSYDHSTGIITANTTIEPEGIPSGTSILRWDVASPQFFNRKEINTGAEEYYFQGIYLKDGRKAIVGRVENHTSNTGADNTGDLLLTIVDNENNSISYSWGGTGDDFITGIIEDEENDALVLSGYAKGELANKSQQWVHGWARSLRQTNDSAEVKFTGIDIDQYGHYVLSGTDYINNNGIISCYDKNFTYLTTAYHDLGPDSEAFNNVKRIQTNKNLLSGYTKNQTSAKSGYMLSLDSDLSTINWAIGFSEGNNHFEVVDHTIIKNSGTEYAVAFVRLNPSTNTGDDYRKSGVLVGVNTENGNVIFRKQLENLRSGYSSYIYRLRPGAPNTGTFFFAGTQGYEDVNNNVFKAPMWGYGDINETNIIKYFEDHLGADYLAEADSQGWNFNEARYEDIGFTNYDSATGSYHIILAGRKEDTSLAAEDSASYTDQIAMSMRSPGHVSTAIYEKLKFVDSNLKTTSIWTKQLLSHKGYVEGVNTLLIEDSDARPFWQKTAGTNDYHNGNYRVLMTGDAVGLDSDASTLKRTDTVMFGINDEDGSLYYRSSFGHMGEDHVNADVVWDHIERNFVVAGWSSSHSPGTDGVLFRGDKEGFGQGVYHTSASTSNAYYYDSAFLYENAFVWSETHKDSNPTVSDAFTTTTDYMQYSPAFLERDYRALEYNGSYGANGLFTGFLGIVKKEDLQKYLNTEQYRENLINNERVHRVDDLFEIHQISTVGDATADDGNAFCYDVIKTEDGKSYWLAGQTSGNIAKQNTGLSGVYDYFLAQWDIVSKEFRFWQNGTAQDEEIYALTELKGTSKTVTNPEAINNGATTGTVSWTPSVAGTYYYQCGNHSAMNGQIIITDTNSSVTTYNITVTNNGTSGFRFTGSDKNGAIDNTVDNPTIRFDTGDTINWDVSALTGHPFWIQTETGTGGAKKGHIAFTGRTTGQLGTDSETPLLGGYDIFLGIFDPRNWGADYYNQGSGFNDKGMNLHDINDTISNTLAITYTSFGSVNGSTTFGSEDIGIITFNYDTDVWSEGFSAGSETSEEIEQNGKASTRLPDGRIAVVANSSGAFADDNTTYGLKDMVLGIFDFDSASGGGYKGWKKYQVGSGSSDFSYSVDNNGSSILIAGYSEATWDKAVGGVLVEFDPERNILAKSSGS